MAPISSTLYVLILIYFSFSTISFVKAQIPNDEVPAELQGNTPPSDIAKNYPYYLSGFDDQNRPRASQSLFSITKVPLFEFTLPSVWVLEFGKWDIRAALLKDEEYVKALDMHIDQATWNFFTSTGLRASPDAPNKEFIVLIDAEGYNLAQLNSAKAVSFVVRKLTMITIATRFASSVYAVNVNFAAERLLSLLKPFLGKEFEKFIIFGTNSAMYIPKILKHLPKDQIPEWYGGSKDFKPVKIYG